MEIDSEPQLVDDVIVTEFTLVAMQRVRHDGWTPERQVAFIKALSVTGSVVTAAGMVRMSRKSAYALCARPDSQSFADAWQIAIGNGRARMFDYMFDRALNGVTTITMRMGGAVELSHGPDRKLVAAQLTSPLPGQRPFNHGKVT